MSNQLSVEGINFSYRKKKVLENVSFTCQNGVIALLGNNGTGKTTLMKMIVGLKNPDSGTIILNDTNLVNVNKYPIHKVGYLPQNFDIYPNISGYDFLSYVYDVKKLPKNSKKQALEEVITKFGLRDVIKKRFSSYSGGYKRRLGIAQAVLGKPDLIIIDEPTVGLDPEQRIEFRSYLAEISLDAITLISTHIIEDVELYSNEILILKDHTIKFQGTVEEIINISVPFISTKNIPITELVSFRKEYKIIEEKRISDDLIKVKYIGDSDIHHDEKEISLENAYIYFQNQI